MKDDIAKSELNFRNSRSSGPGGQHLNKVNSRVEAIFLIASSQALSDEEKELIRGKLQNRINKSDELVLACDTNRSQHRNRELVIERMLHLLHTALVIPKKRKPVGLSKKEKQKRLDLKKRLSVNKQSRSKDFRNWLN